MSKLLFCFYPASMVIVEATRCFSSKLLDVFVLRPDLFYLFWFAIVHLFIRGFPLDPCLLTLIFCTLLSVLTAMSIRHPLDESPFSLIAL